MATSSISREKKPFAIGVVGGSTVVLDVGGLRMVTDPSFDPPGPHGPLVKTEGPAVTPADLGPADVVLLSHDEHLDNFDTAGRAYQATATRTVTTPGAATRLAGSALGLPAWRSTTVPRPDGATLTIEAVPAVHGPLDGTRDATGHVNCEVTGFVLTTPGLPTIYVSGDNASIGAVRDVAARHPGIEVAVLFAGAARTPAKDDARPLTLTSERAADAAILLGARHVVPAHLQGWSLYSEPADRLAAAFTDAGISGLLRLGPLGHWSLDAD